MICHVVSQANTWVYSLVISNEICEKWHYCRIFLGFFDFTVPIAVPHCPIPPHELCDSLDEAALYHNLGPKLGALVVTLHLAGVGVYK
jgi:hypothetical protein